MLFGILILVYAIVILVVYWKWVHTNIINKYDQVFYLYFSIPFVPSGGLALAATTVYILSKLGLVNGYFGM